MTAMKINLDQEENRRMFGGHQTLEGLKGYFHDNYEGTLVYVPMEKKTLHQYQTDPRMTQSGKEIMAIMLEHLEYFLQT